MDRAVSFPIIFSPQYGQTVEQRQMQNVFTRSLASKIGHSSRKATESAQRTRTAETSANISIPKRENQPRERACNSLRSMPCTLIRGLSWQQAGLTLSIPIVSAYCHQLRLKVWNTATKSSGRGILPPCLAQPSDH